jgi:hypothetical protein
LGHPDQSRDDVWIFFRFQWLDGAELLVSKLFNRLTQPATVFPVDVFLSAGLNAAKIEVGQKRVCRSRGENTVGPDAGDDSAADEEGQNRIGT